MKVSDFLKDFHDPRGDLGAMVAPEVAERIAGEMRQILNRDLDEVDIQLEARLYTAFTDVDDMVAAWGQLHASERRAWKNFVNLQEFIRNERRHANH